MTLVCGIAGAFRPGGRPDSARVEKMLDLIAHRGPDGRGIGQFDAVVLGHVRLSILDLSDRAAQPMVSQDGRYAFTYNGEVYNFPELRDRLEKAGVRPRSSGDTEVLLEHLVRFGVDATLPLVEGFFAFGLWDTAEGTLTLARDRLGKKPVYWSVSDGEVRFASEAKALVDGSTVPNRTTVEAMLLGFSGNWGRATTFEGIEALEPGSTVVFDGSCLPRHHRWFSLDQLVDPGLHAELSQLPDRAVLDRAMHTIERSLNFRMVSDVPVACLVSGGVDSSLITVLAAETGSVPDLYHADVIADSERPAAEAVARRVGRPLRIAAVDDASFLEEVAYTTWFNDQPATYHVNAVPFMKVCQRAGDDGVKVLLSGEGSDELFLGYPQFGLAPYLDVIESSKRGARRLASQLAPRVVQQVWPSMEESHNVMLRELVSRGEAPALESWAEQSSRHLRSRGERRAHRASLGLVRGHLTSLLHRNDRLGMAAGIENRHPLLGNEVVHLALNLPAKYKLRWQPKIGDPRHPFVTDKWLIREFASRKMPASLAGRTKQGFPIKVHDRLRFTPGVLRDGFVSEYWGLDDASIDEIFAQATPTWALRLALVEIWGRLFFRQESPAEVSRFLARTTAPRGR